MADLMVLFTDGDKPIHFPATDWTYRVTDGGVLFIEGYNSNPVTRVHAPHTWLQLWEGADLTRFDYDELI